MSGGKHTPGPWNMALCDGESAWMVGPHKTDGQDYVADVHKLTHGRSDADSEANARLIAAAPDLLAVVVRLEALLTRHGWLTDGAAYENVLLRDSRIVIAKAVPR